MVVTSKLSFVLADYNRVNFILCHIDLSTLNNLARNHLSGRTTFCPAHRKQRPNIVVALHWANYVPEETKGIIGLLAPRLPSL